MTFQIFLFVVVCASVVSSDHSKESDESDEDYGEYGYYTTWRKAVCEKNDHEMYKEIDLCFDMEPKEIIDATVSCTTKVAPSSEGKFIPFLDEACKDITMFHKFDKCFEEYEEDPEFEKLMHETVTPEIEECYEKIFEKYVVESLQGYIKKFTD